MTRRGRQGGREREGEKEGGREGEREKRGGGNSPHPCCAAKGGALRNSLYLLSSRLKAYLN